MLRKFLMTAAAALLGTSAFGATVTGTVYELTDAGSNSINPADLWLNSGSYSDANNFKSDWVDSLTNWASVISVRVSMLLNGAEQVFLEFSPGTSKSDFFSAANVTSSSWTDLPPLSSSNYFSIRGHDASGITRNWFVNQRYSGCHADYGWMAVVEEPSPCSWETVKSNAIGDPERLFIYSTQSTYMNYNDSSIGIADTFQVSVTYDNGIAPIPLPATGLLLLGGLAGLGAMRRK